MYYESFVVLCREGKKTLADLDEFVKEWNSSDLKETFELPKVLGLTDEEYNRFVLGEVEEVFQPLIDYKFKYDWELTCPVFPEQYDLYKKGTRKLVAYVRERWDSITVDCPFVWDDRVYDGGGDVTMRVKIEIEAAVEKWYVEHKSLKDRLWIARRRWYHRDMNDRRRRKSRWSSLL